MLGPVLSEGVISIEPVPDEELQVQDGWALTWHPVGTCGWVLGASGFIIYLIDNCTWDFFLGVVV